MIVAVAMSGGVDSTVAAALLRDAGHQVVGVSMVSWRGSLCCSFEDVSRARLMARRLGIKHFLIDLMDAFRDEVVKPYVEGRLSGLTPNPCPSCNRGLKFGKMWQALRLRTQADLLASGHYARLGDLPANGRVGLWRAADTARDQSYMLWQLSQAQLGRLLLPLGELSKAEVRERARELGLPELAASRDSQDLCFVVPDSAAFWQAQAAGRYAPGEIRDQAGQVLGQHKGLVHYTPGQRRGLGVAAGERIYVRRLLPESNTLEVGLQPEQASRLCLQQLNWVTLAPQSLPLDCLAQFRLHGRMVPARLQPLPGAAAGCGPDAGPRAAWLSFAAPLPRVAAGQSLVCYGPDGRLLLGGEVAPEPG